MLIALFWIVVWFGTGTICGVVVYKSFENKDEENDDDQELSLVFGGLAFVFGLFSVMMLGVMFICWCGSRFVRYLSNNITFSFPRQLQ